MSPNQILQSTLDMSLFVLNAYYADLTDAQLLERPGEGCNPLAWQLGHLINSQNNLINDIRPGAGIELPAGFAEQHSKVTAADPSAKYLSKQQYQDLFSQVNAAAAKVLASLTPTELAGPGPERFRQMFPTLGEFAVLIATHPMMHAGQFVPVRRKLGKPVVI
ncbi:MAG: DinB family protein [Pirellulales bacterium]|nr:DinB family protein [Pirellulales bacterium]